jgi:hypothetical protein
LYRFLYFLPLMRVLCPTPFSNPRTHLSYPSNFYLCPQRQEQLETAQRHALIEQRREQVPQLPQSPHPSHSLHSSHAPRFALLPSLTVASHLSHSPLPVTIHNPLPRPHSLAATDDAALVSTNHSYVSVRLCACTCFACVFRLGQAGSCSRPAGER